MFYITGIMPNGNERDLEKPETAEEGRKKGIMVAYITGVGANFSLS